MSWAESLFFWESCKRRRFIICGSYVLGVLVCRWVVENQIGMKNLVIAECDSKQSVYVFGCKDSVLQVKGNYFLIYCQRALFYFVRLGHLIRDL